MRYLVLLYISLTLSMLFPLSGKAQGAVACHALDSFSREPLVGALIQVFREKDSLCLYKGITAKEGGFIVPDLRAGRYLIALSAEGYRTNVEQVEVYINKPVRIPQLWLLSPDIKELQPVIVRKEPDREMHGDTISFRADRYYTRPYATMGELLNKMPGIDVNEVGEVMVMGRIVRRVQVNGRPFFSDDPTIAIKYLPRDVAYKIEIYNDRSDESKFTGVDDGIRILTINIITRNEIKRATLGDLRAGYGTDELYNVGANIHHIEKVQTLSLIASYGNNPPGDALSYGAGLHKKFDSHIQFADSCLGNKGFLNLGFSGSHDIANYYSTSNRQYILGNDSSFFSSTVDRRQAVNASQSPTIYYLYNIDRYNEIIFHSSIRWGQSRSIDTSTSSTANSSMLPVNNSDRQLNTSTSISSINCSFEYGHRFTKRGRSLYIILNADHTSNTSSGIEDYLTQYYLNGEDSSVAAYQRYTSPNSSKRYGLLVSYTEPISSKSSLQLHYNYSVSDATNDHTTFLYDSTMHSLQFDSLLSNYFINHHTMHQGGLTYEYAFNKGFSIAPSLSLQQAITSSNSQGKQASPDLKYSTINPTLSVHWQPGKGKLIDMHYTGNTDHPTPQQLQPLINNTDPLHVQIGNPNLKQSFAHNLSIDFRDLWNNSSGISYSWWVNIRTTVLENFIAQKTVVNALTGADTSYPVNLNGNYSFGIDGGYSLPISRIKSNVDLNISSTDHHSVGFINNTLNPSNTYTFSGGFHWKSNLQKLLDANITGNATYNLSLYPVSPSANLHFWLYTLNAGITAYTENGWQIRSQLEYKSYNGLSPGLNPTMALWNMSLSHSFLKKRQGEVKLMVHDILNQNSAIVHIVTPTMIQDSRSQVLNRYLMVSFIYNLRDVTEGKPISHE